MQTRIVSSVAAAVRRHPGRLVAAGVLASGLLGFALYWFAPWNLFVDRRVDEAVPIVRAEEDAGADGAPTGETAMTEEGADAVAGADGDAVEEDDVSEPRTLAVGRFTDLEHATSGSAVILELEDGSRYLRLQGLSTTNGPDLRVLLSDRPPSDDWHAWADGKHLDLGPLKGNLGSSNYEIPDGVDLSAFRTAVIWCRRFSVGFGVAPLDGLSS